MEEKLKAFPKVEIETHGVAGKIKLDGIEVHGVRRYALVHEAGKVPMLKLDLIAVDVTVDGKQVLPCLPDVFKSFYVPRESDDIISESFRESCREDTSFSRANPTEF